MSELYSVTVAMRRGASLQLLFSAERPAREAYAILRQKRAPGESFAHDRGLAPPPWDPECEVSDRYGVTAMIDRGEVIMCWLSDIGAEHEGKKELALANARAQARANKAAAADSELRAPAIAQPGPATQILGARRN